MRLRAALSAEVMESAGQLPTPVESGSDVVGVVRFGVEDWARLPSASLLSRL